MPDFGIMRGFNEKLFGDKLVAGQLPTQLGLIGSQDVSLLLLDIYYLYLHPFLHYLVLRFHY